MELLLAVPSHTAKPCCTSNRWLVRLGGLYGLWCLDCLRLDCLSTSVRTTLSAGKKGETSR